MNLVELVLTVGKIAIVLGFFLNLAALGVWADRRQGAMVQDRVGPNRAVVHLPNMLARLIVLLPPALFGVLSIFLALGNVTPRLAHERALVNVQLTVLVTWLSLLVLCVTVQRGGAINKLEEMFEDIDPRSIFFGGLGLHALGLVAMRFVTLDGAPAAARITGFVLGGVFLLVGLYATSRVPEGSIPLRLAGTLHALADTIKMIFKEDFVPKNADRLLHSLAPMIAIFPAIVVTAVLPFGNDLCFADNGDKVFGFADLGNLVNAVPASGACAGWRVPLQIADLNVGILYIFAMSSTGIIGAAIAGWASDNKFSLLGGLRACSQMVSYEVAMGLALVGLFLVYDSVRLGDMAVWQGQNAWGVFVQPAGFLLFLTALCAETKRVPFDQPEGESEIVAGYFLEYSGFKWGMFMVGEYLEMCFASALLVALFFGGYSLPFIHPDGLRIAFGDAILYEYKMTHLAVTVISVLGFFGKVVLVTWFQVFFRWTLPRFRYDQLMKLGWTKLLPLAIANMMLTAVVVLAARSAGPAVASWLKILADLSQALIAVLTLAGFVALVVGLLEPVERKKFLASSAARFAAAMGGVKAEPRQA
ncbi:MAG: NADH-quinone oxidoreductase subunit H [Polyangiaceae bacterium]|nr:NADH-quinone oxidoreductase subunit H [Polyangiaceae bacterium]